MKSPSNPVKSPTKIPPFNPFKSTQIAIEIAMKPFSGDQLHVNSAAPGLQRRPRSDGSAPLPEPEKSIGNIWKSSLFTNEIQVIFFNGMILWTPEWINRRIYVKI